MIPAIGYMIGFYIWTRMADLLTREAKTSFVTTALAFITIVVVGICMYALLTNEIAVPNFGGPH